jgi:parvulin-like peptidyl-prolyl isomerase
MKAHLILTLLVVSILLACRGKTPVVAEVGGQRISQAEFEAELQTLQGDYGRTPAGQKEFLELMIRRKIVLQEAERADVAQRASVKEELARLDEAVRRQRAQAREQVLVTEYLRELKNSVLNVSEDEVKRSWESDMETRASHMLFSSSSSAHAVYADLAGGGNFAKLAERHSRDNSTSASGGDLGFFVDGTFIPEFESAVKNLKVGEISPIIPSQYGFHIIQKTAERPLKQTAFEKISRSIRQGLEKRKFQQWVEAARERYTVSINENLLAAAATP